MVYVQMLFALGFDKLIWGNTPGALSIIGSSLILGSAIYVAIHKEESGKTAKLRERTNQEEEQGLMDLDLATAQDSVGQGILLSSVRV
jgi:hypothetical protein